MFICQAYFNKAGKFSHAFRLWNVLTGKSGKWVGISFVSPGKIFSQEKWVHTLMTFFFLPFQENYSNPFSSAVAQTNNHKSHPSFHP